MIVVVDEVIEDDDQTNDVKTKASDEKIRG